MALGEHAVLGRASTQPATIGTNVNSASSTRNSATITVVIATTLDSGLTIAKVRSSLAMREPKPPSNAAIAAETRHALSSGQNTSVAPTTSTPPAVRTSATAARSITRRTIAKASAVSNANIAALNAAL